MTTLSDLSSTRVSDPVIRRGLLGGWGVWAIFPGDNRHSLLGHSMSSRAEAIEDAVRIARTYFPLRSKKAGVR